MDGFKAVLDAFSHAGALELRNTSSQLPAAVPAERHGILRDDSAKALLSMR